MQFSAEKESLVVLENTSLSVKQDSKQNLVAPGVDVVVLIVFAHALTFFFVFRILVVVAVGARAVSLVNTSVKWD